MSLNYILRCTCLNKSFCFLSGIMEALRGMQDLDVPADVDTFSNYILPSFPSVNSARTSFKVIILDMRMVCCDCSETL